MWLSSYFLNMAFNVFRKKLAWQIKLVCVGFLVNLIIGLGASAQKTNYELWPEADIWYKVTPGLRLSSFASVTRYFESNTRDFNISIQADHSFGSSRRFFFTRMLDENRAGKLKTWVVRGGYMGGWSINNASDYTEDMIFTEIHRRFLLKHLILFSQRLRMDNRWIGYDPEFSYRFRYRAMFEREFLSGKTSVIPFFSIEPYWDSRYDEFNRIKMIGGATISWKPRFAFEGNVTYQHDSKSSSTNVWALNAILHLYFESAKVRQNAGKQ